MPICMSYMPHFLFDIPLPCSKPKIVLIERTFKTSILYNFIDAIESQEYCWPDSKLKSTYTLELAKLFHSSLHCKLRCLRIFQILKIPFCLLVPIMEDCLIQEIGVTRIPMSGWLIPQMVEEACRGSTTWKTWKWTTCNWQYLSPWIVISFRLQCIM